MDQELKRALDKILELPDTGYQDYAKTYAKAALCHPYLGREMVGEELRTQLLYVLNNLKYWKGYEAQTTKDILRKHAGVKVKGGLTG